MPKNVESSEDDFEINGYFSCAELFQKRNEYLEL